METEEGMVMAMVVVMVVVSTVWLLPSIMAIWFANGTKRPAEPFLPTISLRFAAGEHSARLPRALGRPHRNALSQHLPTLAQIDFI